VSVLSLSTYKIPTYSLDVLQVIISRKPHIFTHVYLNTTTCRSWQTAPCSFKSCTRRQWAISFIMRGRRQRWLL